MRLERFAFIFVLFFFVPIYASALTAKDAVSEASLYKNVSESIDYLKKTIPNLNSNADKRSVYAFLGSIQEQLGNYEDAQKSYATAASIDAGDASGMPKKSSEQLVIDAVRCALSLGDFVSADRYLSSAVKNSKNEKIIAYRKLYTQWSLLCKAEDISDTYSVITTLKEYSTLDSMKLVRPQVLLTLHHLTDDESYAKKIKSEYPKSMEAGIVKGNVGLLPTPFWFFVPRSEYSSSSKTSNSKKEKTISSSSSTVSKNENATSNTPGSTVKLQLGLFRDEVNAKQLVDKLAKNGFSAKIAPEVRPSGTTYYLVYVLENKAGNMSEKLRASGYECYPLFE